MRQPLIWLKQLYMLRWPRSRKVGRLILFASFVQPLNKMVQR